MRRRIAWMACVALAACFLGCTSVNTFVKGGSRWISMELADNMTYERAWALVTDRLVKEFDLEMLDRESGYFRTGWLYTWTGKFNERYRVRVTGKFSVDRRTLEMKCEAEYGGNGGWQPGYDSRLLSTLQTDILGTLGRTTN